MTEQQIIETLATKVMGWEVVESEVTGKPRWFYQPEKQHCLEISDWNPLQNIADAWQVFEKFGWQGRVGYQGGEYFCGITYGFGEDGYGLSAEGYGQSAQEAICNAALKAIENGYSFDIQFR